MSKFCFVISPIGEEGSEKRGHADNVFEKLIKPSLEKFKISPVRADHIKKPGLITNDMFKLIFSTDLCIAVLSYHNPNVFYELAIAQSCQRPIILLIRANEELPFDIKNIRCIKYDLGDDKKIGECVETISKHIEEYERLNWLGEDIFAAFRKSIKIEVLHSPIEMYQKAAEIISKSKTVIDTTWGPDIKVGNDVINKERHKYLSKKRLVIKRDICYYRELLTTTTQRKERTETDASIAKQQSNYLLKELTTSDASLTSYDFLVGDSKYIILSHIRSEGSHTAKYLYIESQELGSFLCGVFDEYWKNPNTTRLD